MHRPDYVKFTGVHVRTYLASGSDREAVLRNVNRALDLALDGEVFPAQDLTFNDDAFSNGGIRDRRVQPKRRRSGHLHLLAKLERLARVIDRRFKAFLYTIHHAALRSRLAGGPPFTLPALRQATFAPGRANVAEHKFSRIFFAK
ncbi:MAG TPA: hypothetical protein VMG40_05130 [Bryobacteraceae bacterium]|nr:hypothetical protein [Bryobacteraceae bacterium]